MDDLGQIAEFAPLLQEVWPDGAASSAVVEHVSHHGHAEHWRVRNGDRTCIVRLSRGAEAAARIERALEALSGEEFAPELYGWRALPDGSHLIAMEDIDGTPPDAGYAQAHLRAFIDVICRLHAHARFQRAVVDVGRGGGEDSSRGWAEEEWGRLQTLAPSDGRVRRAAPWLARTRSEGETSARSLMVYGHGDLHLGNWRVRPDGRLALLDWEEVRRWPLASEVADFVVFGELEPETIADLYEAPVTYAPAVHAEAAACALSFYLYWLRTVIDGSGPRPNDLAFAARACERLFAA